MTVPSHPTLSYLLDRRERRGAAFVVLVDPDGLSPDRIPEFVDACEISGVDAFFVGGSLVHASALDRFVEGLKSVASIPVIGFPGSLTQLSPHLDALLFLSVVSGRNSENLIGQHVHAAPLIKKFKLEAIPTGYMLVESGPLTTAQYMDQSLPLPRSKPGVAAATAQASELLGMKLLFTDAGSGARDPVPDEIIQAITTATALPLVVGGGLRSAAAVDQKVTAGASIIVIGNAIEDRPDRGFISELADAAHVAEPRPLEPRD